MSQFSGCFLKLRECYCICDCLRTPFSDLHLRNPGMIIQFGHTEIRGHLLVHEYQKCAL